MQEIGDVRVCSELHYAHDIAYDPAHGIGKTDIFVPVVGYHAQCVHQGIGEIVEVVFGDGGEELLFVGGELFVQLLILRAGKDIRKIVIDKEV